jgi:PhnB protein
MKDPAELPMQRPDQFIPQLIVVNALAAMDFYKAALGATEVSRTLTRDGKKLVHGELELDGHLIYVSDEFPASEGGTLRAPATLGGTGVRITVMVDNADTLVGRAAALGAKVLMPVQDMFWGGRYGKFADPFGHEWGVNQKLRSQSEADTQAASDEYFAKRG